MSEAKTKQCVVPVSLMIESSLLLYFLPTLRRMAAQQ
jgi:hypothetical protein